MDLVELLNTWHLIRLTGILAYLFFTMAVVFGLLGRFQSLIKQKAFIFHVHQSASWAGLVTVIIHILLLLVDTYQPYRLEEIIIPFKAAYKSVESGLGTIALFIFLLVIFSSDVLMRTLKRPLWKTIHYLVFPAWIAMLLHGFLIGTDSENLGIFSIYIGSLVLVITIFILKKVDKPITRRSVQRPKHNSKGVNS